jgi:hypothetical protein
MPMQSVLNDFEDRVREISSFFVLLRKFDRADGLLSYRLGKTDVQEVRVEWRATLKATAYLLLYNLVESSIRGAVDYLYTRVKSSGLSANKLREEILGIWVEQEFRGKDAFSASPKVFYDLSRQLVSSAADRAVIEIRMGDLSFGGNLDNQNIIKLCQKHGMKFKVPKAAKGGMELENVKRLRNALAHGALTFEECGREITVAELDRVRRETILFMRAVLKSFKSYSGRKGYLRAVSSHSWWTSCQSRPVPGGWRWCEETETGAPS